MTKISVIIPVYNTEKYLKECLDSIINQTLKDIEIICINDGSTDKSLDILNSYAKSDKRVKIFSQENQGQGVARNYGLSIATGDYIHFMDSDDILELNTLEDTYKLCEEKDLDFVMFKLTNYDDEKDEYYNEEDYTMSKLYKKVGDNIFNYKDLGNLIFNVAVSPVNKLYNHDFIKKYGVKFPENLIFEDNIFFWNAFLNTEKVLFYNEYLYLRRRHSNSTTGGGSKKFIDTIKINNIKIYIFKNHSLFDQYKDKLYNRKVSSIYSRFTQIREEFKNLFFEEMKKDFIKTLEEDDGFIDSLNKRNKKIFETIISINDSEECLLIIEHYDLLNKNKSLKKKQKKMKKQIKKYNKENKIILNSNSWKITKPLRSIGSLRGKNMTFTEKILQHSNSYNFYKGRYEKLTKKTKELTKKNEKLTKKTKELTKKNEKLEYKLNFKENTSNFKSRKLSLTLKELDYTRKELNKFKEELLLMKYKYASLKESKEVDYKHSKTINIAYVLQAFPTLSETFILNELKWLKKEGYNVKVFTYNKPEKLVEDLGFDLEIIHFDFREDLMDTLEKLLVIHEIDLMHTHFAYPTCNTYTYPLAEKLQIPFTFFAHAFDIFIKEGAENNQIKEVTNSKYCKGVFTLSNFHKNHLIEHGVPEDKIIITRQATDYEIKPLKYKPKEIKKIVSISRFVEKKGLDDLIQAAKLLEDEDYIFEMYGFGRLQDELEEQIEELNLNNISIKGSLDNPTEVVNTFKKSDLLVSPCKVAENGDMDGIPTVIFEAMAYGLPVLTTDVSAIPEVIEDGKNGFITSQNNPEALALKIKEISKLSDEELFEIIKTAQKDVKEISSVDKTMNTVLNTWKNI